MVKKRKASFLSRYSSIVVVSCSVTVASMLVVGAVLALGQLKKNNEFSRSLDFEATDVSYCNGEQLDVFVPKSATPVPLVIYIHGGGWRYGGKTGATFEDIKPLVNDGYAVASINYRLSNRAKFPAQIQDVFCSIRYLRHNAAQYKIDGERVGVVGISAGAHLAALAATASDQPDFTVGPFQEQSNQVQAAVLMSGLFDLESEQIQEETSQNLQRLLSGTMYNRGTISPSYYASEEDASQFIIYGTKDKLVSTTQSLNYALQLASLGVATQTLVVEHANHNLQPHFYYKTEPTRQQVTELIVRFFNDKLIVK